MKRNRSIYILSLAVVLSVLCNSANTKAGGYYCSTCKKTFDQAGTHSNPDCTGTFSQYGSASLYSDIVSGPSGQSGFIWNRTDYKCSVCSAFIYLYMSISVTNNAGTSTSYRWSTEKYDSCDKYGPNLTKCVNALNPGDNTPDEYFEEYGRPCKCAGSAKGVSYTFAFNKNY